MVVVVAAAAAAMMAATGAVHLRVVSLAEREGRGEGIGRGIGIEDRDQGRGSTKRFNEEVAHVDYMSSLINKRGKTSGKGRP